MKIIETTSKDGKLIRLTARQWKHIMKRHPEMARRIHDIEEAIRNPTKIVRFSDETTKFYRFIKQERRYIMAAVKILNGEGFVITAYLTKKIRRD